jgi:hypothetical protein
MSVGHPGAAKPVCKESKKNQARNPWISLQEPWNFLDFDLDFLALSWPDRDFSMRCGDSKEKSSVSLVMFRMSEPLFLSGFQHRPSKSARQEEV